MSHALQQLNGDVTLPVPEFAVDSVERAAADPDVVMTLESFVAEVGIVMCGEGAGRAGWEQLESAAVCVVCGERGHTLS